MIRFTGPLTCPTPDDLKTIKTYLPDHITLSRASIWWQMSQTLSRDFKISEA